MKTLKDFNVASKKILVRCDFNVTLDDHRNIVDDFRIQKSLPTIQYLIERSAKIILMSHLGDPEGKKMGGLTLDKVGRCLQAWLKLSVRRVDDCIGPVVKEEVFRLKPKEVLLLENLRFHQEEEENSNQFAKELARLGDFYINEAFSESHRAYASIVGVPKYLPHGIGFLFEKEIEHLDKIVKNPQRPLVVLVGGKKVEDKATYAQKILNLADWVLVGGLVKQELAKHHPDILKNVRMIGPESNLDALDIDEKTLQRFIEKISTAKTIFWNGPFGKFEDERYEKGTREISKAIIESGAFSVVGGGDTVEFLHKEDLIEGFSWISTGGGAMLSYLAGDSLPGLKALEK